MIQDFRLGYRTLGKLNAEKSNAMLLAELVRRQTENLLQFIGPGRLSIHQLFVVLSMRSVTAYPLRLRTARNRR